VLAVGPGQRLTWRALGNGSYQHNNTFAFGSPAFVIGSMVGSAIGNSNRRRQAERDAQPRWVVDGPGEVTITPTRLYFANPVAFLDLEYGALSAIDQVGPDIFQTAFFNNRAGGEQTIVQVHTPWAALIFALAAITAFPAHPLLLTRGWLPPGFEDRCAAMGRPCRPAAGLALESRRM
jgi:hypothetical protein